MAAGEMGDAMIAAREMSEDSAPGWIGQGGKSSVQCFRIIFNHLVKYQPNNSRQQIFFSHSILPVFRAKLTDLSVNLVPNLASLLQFFFRRPGEFRRIGERPMQARGYAGKDWT